MGKVLISYSLVDSEVADELVRTLLKQNLDIVRNVRDKSWGESVELKVDKSFDMVSELLVIVSPVSLNSQWLPYEIGLASGKGKKVIPFITDPSLELPPDISGLACFTKVSQVEKYFSE